MGFRTPTLTEKNPPEFCFIDAGDGDHKEAVYSFVREAGGSPWALPRDGIRAVSAFRTLKQRSDRFTSVGHTCKIPMAFGFTTSIQSFGSNGFQQRFLTPTFDDQQQFTDGSLSLFASEDRKAASFICASHGCGGTTKERFIEGKGLVRKWVTVSRNNHYLDAIALAAAAAGCLGVRLNPSAGINHKSNTEAEHEQRNEIKLYDPGWSSIFSNGAKLMAKRKKSDLPSVAVDASLDDTKEFKAFDGTDSPPKKRVSAKSTAVVDEMPYVGKHVVGSQCQRCVTDTSQGGAMFSS